jgi:hypothetical protein
MRVDAAELQGGACQDLPPASVDKYFLGDARLAFPRMIGKAICGGCAVQAECLEAAIVQPPGHGIRGGQTSAELWDLHARWMDGHIDADVLAAEVIASQKPVGGLRRAYDLRHGRFGTVALACPELGGGDA